MIVNQSWLKRFTSVVAVLGLACAGLLAGVPAFAASPITTQPYTTLLGIDQLHAQGLDGAGVKIAVIDGPVDTTVPELQGVTVIKKAFCPVDYKPSSIAHATEIASILASPYFGWAPKATILNYASPTTDDVPDGETINSAWPDCTSNGHSETIAYQIEQALNDGADVISISEGGASADFDMPFALVRAALKGVPVVMAAGNTGEPPIAGTASPNTVVAVGAVDASGQRASYSSWGAGLSIMAYGGPVTARDPDSTGSLSVIAATQGTSFSAPMVAGALALAKQKWPNANGNQLERVMFDTIDGVADHASAQPSPDMGFGVLNAPLMVATDPSSYSTDNVLAQKSPGGSPTPDDFTAYQNGTADIYGTFGDNDYVYQGCDPVHTNLPVRVSPGPSCQPHASPSGLQTAPSVSPVPVNEPGASIPWVLIGAGIAVVAVLAIVVVLLLRRRKPGPPSTPLPPGWPPTPAWPAPPYPYLAQPPAAHQPYQGPPGLGAPSAPPTSNDSVSR